VNRHLDRAWHAGPVASAPEFGGQTIHPLAWSSAMMMGNIGPGDTWLSHAEPTLSTVDFDG